MVIKMATERELRGKKTSRNAPKAVLSNDLNVPTSDSNAKECVINDDVSKEKDLVRCFCGNNEDFREMLVATYVLDGFTFVAGVSRKMWTCSPKGSLFAVFAWPPKLYHC